MRRAAAAATQARGASLRRGSRAAAARRRMPAFLRSMAGPARAFAAVVIGRTCRASRTAWNATPGTWPWPPARRVNSALKVVDHKACRPAGTARVSLAPVKPAAMASAASRRTRSDGRQRSGLSCESSLRSAESSASIPVRYWQFEAPAMSVARRSGHDRRSPGCRVAGRDMAAGTWTSSALVRNRGFNGHRSVLRRTRPAP